MLLVDNGNVAVLDIAEYLSEEAREQDPASLESELLKVKVLIIKGDSWVLEDVRKVLQVPEQVPEKLRDVLDRVKIPIIAAIEGSIDDVGKELADSCDLRVAAESIADVPCFARVPDGTAFDQAMKTALTIAANAPAAVQEIKRSVEFGIAYGREAGLEFEQQTFALTNSTKEKRERMEHFLNSGS